MLYRDASNRVSAAYKGTTEGLINWFTNKEISTDYFNGNNVQLNCGRRPMRATNTPVSIITHDEPTCTIPVQGDNWIPIQVYVHCPGSMQGFSVNSANTYYSNNGTLFNYETTLDWTFTMNPTYLTFAAAGGTTHRWTKGEFGENGIITPTHLYSYINVANGGNAAPPVPINISRTGDWRIVSNTMRLALYGFRKTTGVVTHKHTIGFSLGENCCFFASNTNEIVLPSLTTTQTGSVHIAYERLIAVLYVNIVEQGSYCNLNLAGSGSNMYRGNISPLSFTSNYGSIVQTV